jgi:hypothetical protein
MPANPTRRDAASAPKGAILIGVIATLMGLFVVGVGCGLIAPRPLRAHEAPPWLLVVLGTMFALGGIALVIGQLRGDLAGRIQPPSGGGSRLGGFLRLALGLFMLGGFAVLASWAAFGSGPRAFRVNLPLLGGETSGRMVFGIAAAVVWTLLLAALIAAVRRRASNRSAVGSTES